MNDRALRNIVVGLGAKADGVPREDHFVITVASEIMAILCLADDMDDLKKRLSRIIVAYTRDGEPVTAGQLQAVGAMAALLKDAIKPNLVQTLEHNPVIIHGGPFANIAHGCNSVRATKTALGLSDITVTEAGFGADLGAEKFLDIKCRMGVEFYSNFSNEALSVVNGHHSGGVGPAVNRRIVSCRPGQPTWMWAEGASIYVTSRPYPIAERNKMREPCQRRFTAGSPGCQGGGD